MIRTILFIVFLAVSQSVTAHGRVYSLVDSENDARFITFPDTKDHKTLVVDLHTHSVFSDGHVWPSLRVAEAERDGLDAVAITEHLEYQPHSPQLPNKDRNAAYLEAKDAASDLDMIVISGVEITRKEPMGHMNAVFVKDANALIRLPESDDHERPWEVTMAWPTEEAVRTASEQGAFVFWNHPWASSDEWPADRTRATDFHKTLFRKGYIHGIEVVNGKVYNEEAHAIALKYNLALIGTSDVHNLIDWDYEPHTGGHRPVTLVFTEEKTSDSLKEALFAKRTAIWFKNLLIARKAEMQPLLEASLTIDAATIIRGKIAVTLTNHSDVDFRLRHTSTRGRSFSGRADLVDLPQHSSLQLYVKPEKMKDKVTLEFEVLNALVAPNQRASIRLEKVITSEE